MQRTILVASYYFPPDAAVGGLRLAKFVRTLPEFGWRPLVLTIRNEYRDQGFDAERLQGLEDIRIVRTGELPRISKWLRSVALPKRRPADVEATAAGSAAPGPGETLTGRLKRWVISLTVLLPDDKKHWACLAAFTALRLIRRGKIEYVLTSGPPFSTHLIGLLAKSFARTGWVADFRDPWVDMLPERFPHTRSWASDFVERRMEALVARTADTVVVTTPRMLEAFRARYPAIDRERFVCIPNSIDTEKFPVLPEEKREPLTITYAGSLYFHRTPEPLFQAVSELLTSGRIAARDIRIQLVGHCSTINGVDTASVVRRYGLEGVVDVLSPVPYVEAIRMMQRSHLLLVLAPERHRLVVPAKFYDYLGSGSKVLALAERGATADLMAETDSGECFSETDVSGLREYLGRLIADGSYRTMRNAPGAFAEYDVRHLTGRLVARMEAASTETRGEVVVRG
jgi:glycosyltransferase involved in cell wall biosynthesis